MNNKIPFDPEKQFIKYKRRRDTFKHRLDSLLTLPKEIQNKFTYSNFCEDISLPVCLKYPKGTNKREVIALQEEIDEIVNELEFFQRNNRKKKTISLMEGLAEDFDENKLDIEELTDLVFFGDKVSNIENEYLHRRRNKYLDNKRFCEYTNRMLLDDDEIFLRRKSDNEPDTIK